LKFVATIEARMNSTRLPGKTMKKILGKPLLELMIERVLKSKKIKEIVIATSTNAENDPIEELCNKLGVKCFRGSEDDVLERVLKAAQSCKADVIIELWGDCPLIDPTILDKLVEFYEKNEFDCVGTMLPNFKKTYPLGISALIFSTRILEEVNELTHLSIDRENVSNYIYEHPQKYKITSLPCPDDLKFPNLRLMVDESSDFELVKNVFEKLYPYNKEFSTVDVIQFLDSNPRIRDLNKHVRQKTLPKWDKLKKKSN